MLHCQSCLMSQPRRILRRDISRSRHKLRWFLEKTLLLCRWMDVIKLRCILSFKEVWSCCAVRAPRLSWNERKQAQRKGWKNISAIVCTLKKKKFFTLLHTYFWNTVSATVCINPPAWKEKHTEECWGSWLWCQPPSPSTVLHWSTRYPYLHYTGTHLSVCFQCYMDLLIDL